MSNYYNEVKATKEIIEEILSSVPSIEKQMKGREQTEIELAWEIARQACELWENGTVEEYFRGFWEIPKEERWSINFVEIEKEKKATEEIIEGMLEEAMSIENQMKEKEEKEEIIVSSLEETKEGVNIVIIYKGVNYKYTYQDRDGGRIIYLYGEDYFYTRWNTFSIFKKGTWQDLRNVNDDETKVLEFVQNHNYYVNLESLYE